MLVMNVCAADQMLMMNMLVTDISQRKSRQQNDTRTNISIGIIKSTLLSSDLHAVF